MNKCFMLLSIVSLTMVAGCSNSPKDFKITWMNYDSSVLKETIVQEGAIPSYDGELPTRAKDETYKYTFKGWNPEIEPATKDASYIAVFEPSELETYTITWKNGEEVLKVDSVKEGDLPVYTGDTPTKPSTPTTDYSFSGWTPTVSEATCDTIYYATFTETEIPLSVSSIKDVISLCKKITDLNRSGIKVDMNQKVKIKGNVFYKTNLVKTTKNFDLNVSAPGKVFIGDETGYIACASTPGSEGTCLYGKVKFSNENPHPYYEITGYVSMYLNQPEIYVPSDKSYYTYIDSVKSKYDFSKISIESSISEYYEKVKTISYNCAGHGYGGVFEVKNISIIDNYKETYIGTDGTRMINIKGDDVSLIKGNVYDVCGIIQTNSYIPSIHALKCASSKEKYTDIKLENCVDKTIDEFNLMMNSLPFDDTFDRFDSIVESFQYCYKSSGYVSAYQVDGKLYVTLNKNFDSGETYPSRESSIAKGNLTFRNEDCWNKTQNEILSYCHVKDYFDQNKTLDLYYSPVLFDNYTINTGSGNKKYHGWKVMSISSLVSNLE